jgi:hypothetical protein
LDLAGGTLANPQSWDKYAYVTNNPVNAVDPLGLLPIPACTFDNTCPGPLGGGWSPALGGAGLDACGIDPFCIGAGGLGPFDFPEANLICKNGGCQVGSWADTAITPDGVYINATVQTDFYTKNRDYITSLITNYINLFQFSGAAGSSVNVQGYSWLNNGTSELGVATVDYLRTHPITISANEIGAFQYTYQASSNTACINVGVGASVPPTKAVTVGLLNAGDMRQWQDVQSSWGYSLGANFFLGYQGSFNSSGTIGGPTVSGIGLSGSYTYGGCATLH